MLADILTLATTTAAATIPRNAATPSADYIWDILKWQAGQSHGAPTAPLTAHCHENPDTHYYFNVFASEYGYGPTRVPGFFVHCAGHADGKPLSSEYTNCDLEKADETADAAVFARVLPDPNLTKAHIAISYLFNAEDGSKTRRNFTVVIVEDWARERPPHNFTVVPTEVS
ncbi:uncharacterized protein F4817DRAFT_363696 [Daldinia loculata]|uniref:uncharacterized protein n=1 Tax=Daldinia loculata TaxID=103429 RepID=UPI0020C4DD7C|nr:uncharacterized protein F4817DRAFT_363696 [Daldinia loculata]KAI1649366.1 hypothetical protein F4817DRAFT_363696 [Daldinia loculata]